MQIMRNIYANEGRVLFRLGESIEENTTAMHLFEDSSGEDQDRNIFKSNKKLGFWREIAASSMAI
jgi:hypothetical protein